jgi:hypothetical protein
MFEYFILLWAKHRVPIFPVAVYLRGGRSAVMNEKFVMGRFGREQLRFQFPAVALARFEALEYVEKGDAVAAALAPLMSRRRAGPSVELKLSMMERVVKSRLDEARKFLLLNLIEANFKLGAGDKRELERRLSEERYREVRKMQLTWAEKLERKVRKEGREEGREEGLKDGLKEGRWKANERLSLDS